MTRKYVLTRLQAGDYLLPGNDGSTLWRVYTYEEDGSLYRGERQVKGKFWATAKWRGTVDEAQRWLQDDPDILLDWNEWEFWAGPLTSRADAVEEVVRASEKVAAMREP